MSLVKLIAHPFMSATYALLILSFISLWVHRRWWIWGSLLALSYVFALFSKITTPESLVPLTFLLAAHLVLHFEIKGLVRYLALTVAFIISAGLALHLMPGFNNWLFAANFQVSQDAVPYNYYLNYDKPYIGIFTLALNLPLITTTEQLKRMLIKALPITAFTIIFLFGFSGLLGFAKFDLKWTTLFFIWPITNLFLVVIPEEVFFRGFLQKEIEGLINSRAAGWMSVLIVSVGFAAIHLNYLTHPAFIFLTFIASFAYGSIFYLTRAIEGSILAHFFLNLIHFTLFTYPMLKLS